LKLPLDLVWRWKIVRVRVLNVLPLAELKRMDAGCRCTLLLLGDKDDFLRGKSPRQLGASIAGPVLALPALGLVPALRLRARRGADGRQFLV
jgi:hypothetical protein